MYFREWDDSLIFIFRMKHNGLAMRSIPKGIAYRFCCAPFLFFLSVKLAILFDNFWFGVGFEQIVNVYGGFFEESKFVRKFAYYN